jgi:hypothetical protein
MEEEMIKIHGKEYIEVNERLIEFWKEHPAGAVITEVLKIEDNFVLIKASVKFNSDFDHWDATGHAFENRDCNRFDTTLKASKINLTSYIENCETSAIGRALAVLGYGIETSLASAEEVTQAIEQQKSGKTPKKPLKYAKVNERENPDDTIWKMLKTAWSIIGDEQGREIMRDNGLPDRILSCADAQTLVTLINSVVDKTDDIPL